MKFTEQEEIFFNKIYNSTFYSKEVVKNVLRGILARNVEEFYKHFYEKKENPIIFILPYIGTISIDIDENKNINSSIKLSEHLKLEIDAVLKDKIPPISEYHTSKFIKFIEEKIKSNL